MANLAHIHEVYKVDRDAADGVQHGYDLAPLAAGHQAPVPAVCDEQYSISDNFDRRKIFCKILRKYYLSVPYPIIVITDKVNMRAEGNVHLSSTLQKQFISPK